MTLPSVLGSLRFLGHFRNDDFTDRLNYFFTSNLLVSLSILVSWKQFGGKPMECMVPDFFPGAWEQYAENFCWAQDTYFLPMHEEVPKDVTVRYDSRISYYQWVPFFLLFEAACFRLPSLIWKYMAGHSGIKIHDIIKLATDEKNVEREVKENNVKSLTTHLQNALRFHRRLYRRKVKPHRVMRILNLPYTAFFVTTVYLATKICYLINITLQLVLMNKFLETTKYGGWYGWGALSDIMNGTTWELSGVFPRVSLCDFEVRVMGNVQRYSVQCVLVINIFNEKIFIFLWFWYNLLLLLTAFSLIYWAAVMLFPWPSRWFVSRHLELSEMPFDPVGSRKDVERFVVSYLKTDGVFVLRMITMHAGIIFGTDLLLSLWNSFYGIEHKVQRSESDPGDLKDQSEDNKQNALRLRFKSKSERIKGERRKGTGKGGDDGDDDSLDEILTSKEPKKPTAPSALDMPDSKAPTMRVGVPKKLKDEAGTAEKGKMKKEDAERSEELSKDLEEYVSAKSNV